MKILVITNSSKGLQGFRSEVIKMLSEKGDVFLCMPPNDKIAQYWHDMGCQCIDCDILDRRGKNPLKELQLIHFYKKTIKMIQPDLVLTYTIKPNVYGGIACQITKVPYIANVTGLGTTIENGGLLSSISTFLYKVGLKSAKCVFFQNKDNQKLFVDRKIVNGKTRLIPGSGVNLETHKLEPYPDEADGVRFLFVGRIMRDKGINELLEAIRQIYKENQSVTLDVVGGQDENYSGVLAQAESEGLIKYHGAQLNMHPFYENCHCAVLPSYHEGMANVMLEASSTGRPVVTTRVPGCKETFDEGVTGFGCEAKNTESLVEAMKKILSLSREQRISMGLAARRKMEKEFDRKIVVKAYQDEIEELMNFKGKGGK